MTRHEGGDMMIVCERARKNEWRGGMEGLCRRRGGRWREMKQPRIVFQMQDEIPEDEIRDGGSQFQL